MCEHYVKYELVETLFCVFNHDFIFLLKCQPLSTKISVLIFGQILGLWTKFFRISIIRLEPYFTYIPEGNPRHLKSLKKQTQYTKLLFRNRQFVSSTVNKWSGDKYDNSLFIVLTTTKKIETTDPKSVKVANKRKQNNIVSDKKTQVHL